MILISGLRKGLAKAGCPFNKYQGEKKRTRSQKFDQGEHVSRHMVENYLLEIILRKEHLLISMYLLSPCVIYRRAFSLRKPTSLFLRAPALVCITSIMNNRRKCAEGGEERYKGSGKRNRKETEHRESKRSEEQTVQ